MFSSPKLVPSDRHSPAPRVHYSPLPPSSPARTYSLCSSSHCCVILVSRSTCYPCAPCPLILYVVVSSFVLFIKTLNFSLSIILCVITPCHYFTVNLAYMVTMGIIVGFLSLPCFSALLCVSLLWVLHLSHLSVCLLTPVVPHSCLISFCIKSAFIHSSCVHALSFQ